MVGGVIGIAKVVIALRMGDATFFARGKHQCTRGRMRAVAAYQRDNAKDLGSNVQSGQPRTQATPCCRPDHSDPAGATEPDHNTRLRLLPQR